MKRKKVIALALLFAFVFSGCTPIKPDSADRISRPKNMAAPVTGTWRLENLQGGRKRQRSKRPVDRRNYKFFPRIA